MKFGILPAGTVIEARYRVTALIGRGGMGDVYAAEDLRLGGMLRAVKLLTGAAADDDELKGEAAMLTVLRHPRLPQIVDFIPPTGSLPSMLVTEYVDGMTLRQSVEERRSALGLSESVSVTLQLCDALAYLHEQQPPIVHRDLKPSNVMIDASGFVSLIDFGIARRVRSGTDTLQLGTPGFAAPELGGLNGRSDERSDQYGLGALLFYMLSGGLKHEPGAGSGRTASLCPQAPAALVRVLERMLALRPEQRYPSISAAAESIRRSMPPASEMFHKRARHDSRSRDIAVVSASPGSGGTFIAITLAKLLTAEGRRAAYVEHYSREPEAFVMLQGDLEPANSVLDGRYGHYRDRESGAWLLTLRPDAGPMPPDADLKYRLMLAGLDADLIVQDVSGGWDVPHASESLRSCGTLLVVADPFPAKWSLSRMHGMQAVMGSRRSAGKDTLWIANKDMSFRSRTHWLSMFPERPAAAIPHLPPAEWAEWLWRGRWPTAHPVWGLQLAKAMKPLTERLTK